MTYRSPKERAKKATIALCLMGAFILIEIWITYSEIALAQDIVNGVEISEAQVVSNDIRQGIFSVASFICTIATAILFLRWEALAYGNLKALGTRETRTITNWLILNWLIPFISFFRPYLDMKELWTESHPASAEDEPKKAKDSRMSKLIGPWWLTWLAGQYILSQQSFNGVLNGPTTWEEIITWNYTLIVGNILIIAALPLIILLIKQITANQEIKSGQRATTTLTRL